MKKKVACCLTLVACILLGATLGQRLQGTIEGQNASFNYDASEGQPTAANNRGYAMLPIDWSNMTSFSVDVWIISYGLTSFPNQAILHAGVDSQNFMVLRVGNSTESGNFNAQCVMFNMVVEGNMVVDAATCSLVIGKWTHISIGYQPEGTSYVAIQSIIWPSSPGGSQSIDPVVTVGEFSSNLPSLSFLAGAETTLAGWNQSRTWSSLLGISLGGFVDEFRIWDIFRTVSTATAEMTTILSGDEPGLYAYYPLDESYLSGVSNVLLDATPSSRDGVTFGPNFPIWRSHSFPTSPLVSGNYVRLFTVRKTVDHNEKTQFTYFASTGSYSTNVTIFPYGAKVCAGANASPSCVALTPQDQLVQSPTWGTQSISFFPQRGACGSTQTLTVTSYSFISTVTPPAPVHLVVTVSPISPILDVKNYTLPTVGGQITLTGSDFGIIGPLDPVESIIISTPSGNFTCSSPTVTGVTSITCSVAPGMGKNYLLYVSLCNGRKPSFTPTFSYEAPVIYSAALVQTAYNSTALAIGGKNFGPLRSFIPGSNDFIHLNSTECIYNVYVNDSFISCETYSLLNDGTVYNLVISIAGQSVEYPFNYSLCPIPCENGGRCVGLRECDCRQTSFEGPLCETPLICDPSCKNGGYCFRSTTDNTKLLCSCSSEWTGEDCSQSTLITDITNPEDSALIIGLSSGGGGLVLLLGAAVVYLFFFRTPKRGTKNFIPLEKKDFTKIIYGEQLNMSPEKTNADLGLLEKMLVSDDMKLTFLVSSITQITEADKIAKALVIIFQENNKVLSLLQAFIDEEVKNTESAGTLFRSNSMVSKMFKFYSRLIGLPYLYLTVGPELDELIAANLGLEVDPEKMDEGADLDEMRWMLMAQSQKILKQILNSSETCPVQFRTLFSHIKFVVGEKFKENVNTTIGGFIFLRFFCPAISSPEAYGILEEPPTPQARRLLILITKVLQNLSNDVEFGSKEPYMAKMNDFIQSNRPKISMFYEKLIKATNKQSTDIEVPKNMKPLSLSVIANHIRQNLDAIEDQTLKKRLDTIV